MAITLNQDVYSSTVQNVSYDDETKDLFVTFQKGAKYVYRNVPAELATNLANAPSVGSMLRNEIEKYYSYARVG